MFRYTVNKLQCLRKASFRFICINKMHLGRNITDLFAYGKIIENLFFLLKRNAIHGKNISAFFLAHHFENPNFFFFVISRSLIKG